MRRVRREFADQVARALKWYSGVLVEVEEPKSQMDRLTNGVKRNCSAGAEVIEDLLRERADAEARAGRLQEQINKLRDELKEMKENER